MRAFEAIHFTATAPGPRLIVTGAVHGNETCGTVAIRRVLGDIEQGRIGLAAGEVTFVPVTNPLAYERGQRQGDRNQEQQRSGSVDRQQNQQKKQGSQTGSQTGGKSGTQGRDKDKDR